MLETFFTLVFQGDIRSIVILVLLAAILYIILKIVFDIKKKYNGFFTTLMWVLIGLTVCGLIYWPQTVQSCFLGLVDTITPIVEAMFVDQDKG